MVIDTNVAIACMNAPLQARRQFAPSAVFYLPVIVEGELFFGARKSRRVAENLMRVEHFVETTHRLVIDGVVARRFGEVKAQLRAKGTMIPENDVWIAATAMVHMLALVTADNHFESVEGLNVIRW